MSRNQISKESQEFGQWVKELRLKNDLTQAELSKALGMPGGFSQSIANIESGRVMLPYIKYGKAFCKALRVQEEELKRRLRAVEAAKVNSAF